jgi:hypothetical protein
MGALILPLLAGIIAVGCNEELLAPQGSAVFEVRSERGLPDAGAVDRVTQNRRSSRRSFCSISPEALPRRVSQNEIEERKV